MSNKKQTVTKTITNSKPDPLQGVKHRSNRKYKDSFKEKVISMGKEGSSLVQIANALDVSRSMLYRWAHDDERYPGFGEALDRARECAEAYWEQILQDGIMGKIKGFKEISMIFMMKARFKDWHETTKKQIEVTNKTDTLTDKELDEKIKTLKIITNDDSDTGTK